MDGCLGNIVKAGGGRQSGSSQPGAADLEASHGPSGNAGNIYRREPQDAEGSAWGPDLRCHSQEISSHNGLDVFVLVTRSAQILG
jgi:hypothetical protein